MSSFDDLQFSGLQSSTTVPVPCSMCGRIIDVSPTALTCPAGHILPPHSLNPLLPHHLPPPSRPPPTRPPSSSSSPDPSHPFFSFPGLSPLLSSSFPSSTFLDLLRAQQGFNVDELMQQLLTEPGYEGTPTSPEYLKALKEEGLKEDEFVQVSVRVEGVDRDVLPTWGEFGGRVKHAREEGKKPGEAVGDEGETAEGKEGEAEGERKEEEEEEEGLVRAERLQEHVQVELVMAEPLDGKALSNGGALRGRAALLSRGRISFVDKCRAVQQSGALLALVQQTEDAWPYVMTDQAGTGKDIVRHAHTASLATTMLRHGLASHGSLTSLSCAWAVCCVWLLCPALRASLVCW